MYFAIIIILNIVAIFISLYLFFLYIKSKEFHKYPCYNIMIISVIIFVDNILRLISSNNIKVLDYIQAFMLTFLDKLLLTTITAQAFIIYLGVVKTKFYFKYEKKIFFIILIIIIFINFIITSIYIFEYGIDKIERSKYYYCGNNNYKIIIDTIFNSIFVIINSFCVIRLLFYISKKKKEVSLGIIEDLDYGHHYTKILLMFFINSITFIESYLIIYIDVNEHNIEIIDLIYLLTCLCLDLYYTINKIILKETLRIFCTKIYDKKYNNNASINERLTKEDEEF